MNARFMRRWIGLVVILAASSSAALLYGQVATSRQELDKIVKSSDREVRTGENLKLPASGDWRARYQETDFPVVKKVDDSVYLFQMPHPGIKGWLVNSLIVITGDGVVIIEGQMNGAKLVEAV
ncbi:MAG TPA: hypothetical protein VGH04_04815, partial [Gemmatimonadaceae bacterium]